MFKSGDTDLCPLISRATKFQRVNIVPKSSNESEVCLFYDDRKKTSLLRADHVRSKIWAIVVLIEEDVLSHNKDNIGLHFIPSGGAIAMFLSVISAIIIMRVGSWSSEAFLEYIRKQVESFTFGVSRRMLKFEEFSILAEKIWRTQHMKCSTLMMLIL